MTERVIEIVGFQRFTRDKLGDDYDVNGTRLRCKRKDDYDVNGMRLRCKGKTITMYRKDDYDVNGM